MNFFIKKRCFARAVTILGMVGMSSYAVASPVTLTGNYVQVGISDYGTFGSDGSTEPGILHDPTGKGNFYPDGVANDYLTPGSPHDGFAINSDQTGFLSNDNYGYASFGSSGPTITTVAGYALAATWMGTIYDGGGAAVGSITNTYFYNPGDERVNVTTTITALADAGGLTNLYFGRSEDPDPDVNRYGSFSTINTRGDSSTAPENLVSGAGELTGLTLGILNTSSTFASNTDISFNCCSNNDPSSVFNGTDSNGIYGTANYPNTAIGDYGLQMAWNIGSLDAGASATIDYAYVMGTAQGSVSMSTVPLPAALPMFGIALLVLVGFGMSRWVAPKGDNVTVG